MLTHAYCYGWVALMWSAWHPRRPITSERFALEVTGNLDAPL